MTEKGRGKRKKCGYVENMANEHAAVGYAPGTADCLGTKECQFKNFREAELFCSSQADCTAIVQLPATPELQNCVGDLGCFTPRSGPLAELAEDKGLKSYIYQCST